MRLPTHEELARAIADAFEELRALDRRIAALGLLDVLVVTRDTFPGAAFIRVEDDEGQGLAGAPGEVVLDGTGRPLPDPASRVDRWRRDIRTMADTLGDAADEFCSDYVHRRGPVPGLVVDLGAIEAVAQNLSRSLSPNPVPGGPTAVALGPSR